MSAVMDHQASVESSDRAVAYIVAANAFTLALALLQGWSLLALMWPYWLQSLIIGWFSRRRILLLRNFSTKDFSINDKPVEPTPATRDFTANFFLLHYGLFHLGYLAFLLAATLGADPAGMLAVTREDTGARYLVEVGRLGALDFIYFAVLGWSFWWGHRRSHEEHVAADLGSVPQIGTLMMLPYGRVLPMHLTIVLGMLWGSGAVWLFILLKTAADVGMHKAEHRLLGNAG